MYLIQYFPNKLVSHPFCIIDNRVWLANSEMQNALPNNLQETKPANNYPHIMRAAELEQNCYSINPILHSTKLNYETFQKGFS